ncbi:MAG: TonB-dependent receptor [Chitinophagaceae bacterium]|nr:TonB-dependent receptor [Chitinophagaceae bacterium]
MRILFRVSSLVFALILFYMQAIAQTSITGTVADGSAKRPVEFATVQLLSLPDSLLVKGTVTDKRGRYTIDEVQGGSYLVRCSFIGYDVTLSPIFTIAVGQPSFSVSRLDLVPLSNTLDAVTVTGTRSQLNASIDRKVYNVDQDIMSRTGTASDILKNIPSVEVDVDGNVALRGSGDVMILINGKPNPLMGRTRAEVLQQLPANSIERIEVITNPSARYRPDGAGGIINIVLKKNIRSGFNGTVTVNAGNKDRYNGSLTLNFRPKKFNLFGSYSYRRDTRLRYNTIDRTYLDSLTGAEETQFNQSAVTVSHPVAHIVTSGIDYIINEQNSFGVSATYYSRRQTINSTTGNVTNDGGSLIETFNRVRRGPESERQTSGTAYFQHDFSKDGHDLRIEFNTSKENEVEDNRFSNIYMLPTQSTSFDNTLIMQEEVQNQLTADYSNQLSEDSKLEAGYDGLYDKVDLDFFGEYYDDAQSRFVKDMVRSNRFLYKQDVHAIYGTFQKAFKKFGYELGVRFEGVIGKGRLVNIDSLVDNRYFKVYPTMHLSYKITDNSEVQLNYSKRVNRPDPDELNPFPEYQDPRNLRAGNPALLPEITHSTELGYKWQDKNFTFVPSIYYRFKRNGFTSVIIALNDSTLLSTMQNLSTDQSAGIEAIISVKAGDFLTTSLTTNLFYNRINASNLGFLQSRSVYSGSATLTGSMAITKTFLMQLSGNYRSARLTAQGKTYPTLVMNGGIRKDFPKAKLSTIITVSDIFRSLRQKTILDTRYLNQLSVNRRDGLVVYFGVSYRFGIVKKEKEENMQFDNSL